jgi:hypothetical protein
MYKPSRLLLLLFCMLFSPLAYCVQAACAGSSDYPDLECLRDKQAAEWKSAQESFATNFNDKWNAAVKGLPGNVASFCNRSDDFKDQIAAVRGLFEKQLKTGQNLYQKLEQGFKADRDGLIRDIEQHSQELVNLIQRQSETNKSEQTKTQTDLKQMEEELEDRKARHEPPERLEDLERSIALEKQILDSSRQKAVILQNADHKLGETIGLKRELVRRLRETVDSNDSNQNLNSALISFQYTWAEYWRTYYDSCSSKIRQMCPKLRPPPLPADPAVK